MGRAMEACCMVATDCLASTKSTCNRGQPSPSCSLGPLKAKTIHLLQGRARRRSRTMQGARAHGPPTRRRSHPIPALFEHPRASPETGCSRTARFPGTEASSHALYSLRLPGKLRRSKPIPVGFAGTVYNAYSE
jgi:hypothetical protein